MGPQGRGTPAHFGVTVDILTGTLGKALGRRLGRLYRRSAAGDRSAAAAGAALSVFQCPAACHRGGGTGRARSRRGARTICARSCSHNAAYWRAGLADAGFDLLPGEHPIIPVMLGEAPLAQAMARDLFGRGVHVSGFFFPGGAQGPGAHPHADERAADAGRSGFRIGRLPRGGQGHGGVWHDEHDEGAGQGKARAGPVDGDTARCPRSGRTTC